MMELLQEILFTGVVSFLFALLVAKFVSSSSSPSAPADHLRHRHRHGRVEISASVAGGCGGGYVVIEEERGGEGGREKVVGVLEEVEEEEGKLDGCGSGLEKEMVRSEVEEGGGFENDGIVEVEVLRSDAGGERSDFGKVDVELVEADGGVRAEDVLTREDEKVVKEIRLGSGSGLEKVGEERLVGGVGEELNLVSLPLDGVSIKEIRLDGEVGVGGIEDEEDRALPFNEDDDWEGIERSALEKLFGVASAFVGSVSGREALSRLSSELQMQLYGLHKIATEGPCYETQPLALKVSARSKWHAWQKLGNMNPEVAMEQYIALLTDNISEWMEEANFAAQSKMEEGNDSSGAGVSALRISSVTSSQHSQQLPETERKEVFS